MPEIVTRCPTCQTAFRVTPEQLETANGRVRCGKCAGVFNAPEQQLNRIITPAQQSAATQDPKLFTDQDLREKLEKDAALPRLTALIHNEFSEQQPSPQQSNTHRSLLKRLAVVALGALILTGQVIYFLSAELSRNEDYRQPLVKVCYHIGCKINPYHDLSKLSINAFIIQSHPTQSGAVIVDMMIENKAQFRQSFPQIKVRFDDLQGRLVTQRVFSPEEYISQQTPRRSTLIKNISSGRQAHVSFSLLDPGLSATNYSVQLSD